MAEKTTVTIFLADRTAGWLVCRGDPQDRQNRARSGFSSPQTPQRAMSGSVRVTSFTARAGPARCARVLVTNFSLAAASTRGRNQSVLNRMLSSFLELVR